MDPTVDALVRVAVVAATAVHLGFQLTVTSVVYPALAEVGTDRWAAAHAGHTRRITPLVAVAYGLVLVASVAATAVGPRDLGWLLGVVGTVLAVGTTLLVAGPTHARLTSPDPRRLRRLRRADHVRTVGAALALVGAILWAV